MTVFDNCPDEPRSNILLNAYHLLINTHKVCNDFSNIYDLIMVRKITENVTIADNYLDLFRSALLFSSSGLDSLAKQLVRDSLSEVVKKNLGAKNRLRSYVEKKISRNDMQSSKILANALMSDNPREHFLECLVKELTDRSLQSNDELLNVASYFDIPSNVLADDLIYLRNIFGIRNQIAHEMDFDYTINTRRVRSREELYDATNYIFKISSIFLREVDDRLK